MQAEILARLEALAPLGDNVPRVYAWPFWPGNKTLDYEVHLDQWARITGCTSLDWRYWKPEIVEREIDRCRRLRAKLCVHVSPPVPNGGEHPVYDAVMWIAARWKRLRMMGLRSSDIDVISVDLEGFRYSDDDDHNKLVHRYNTEIYGQCKQAAPHAEVRRYMHMGITRNWRPETRPYTGRPDLVDGGFGIDWYRPNDHADCYTRLQDTCDFASRHGVDKGSVWLTLGAAEVEGQCPGVELYRQVAGKVYEVPYDPFRSFRIGALWGNPWIQAHEDCPPLEKVHSLVVWPGLFDPRMERTSGVHLCAFLEGLACKTFDPRLREMQVEAWGGTQ